MNVTLVHVRVKQECVDDFIEDSAANQRSSVEVPGNLLFDVLQLPEDPCRFLLYEAYVYEDAAYAHKKTDHYLAWRETVADMMAEPRHGEPFNGCLLYTSDAADDWLVGVLSVVGG